MSKRRSTATSKTTSLRRNTSLSSWKHPHETNYAGNTSRRSPADNMNWKALYDKEMREKRKMKKKIADYENTMKALNKELQKEKKENLNSKHYRNLQRKLKQTEREMKIQKRKLKLANDDLAKSQKYYRKQIDVFKLKQNKLLEKQKNAKKNKDAQLIKYVFVDDIKKIKLRGKGKNAGIRVFFKDGDEAVFNDIDIEIPVNAEDDYKGCLKELKYEDHVLSNNRDILNQNDYESVDYLLFEELNERIKDMVHLTNLVFNENIKKNDYRTNAEDYIDRNVKQRHDEFEEKQKNVVNNNNKNSQSMNMLKPKKEHKKQRSKRSNGTGHKIAKSSGALSVGTSPFSPNNLAVTPKKTHKKSKSKPKLLDAKTDPTTEPSSSPLAQSSFSSNNLTVVSPKKAHKKNKSKPKLMYSITDPCDPGSPIKIDKRRQSDALNISDPYNPIDELLENNLEYRNVISNWPIDISQIMNHELTGRINDLRNMKQSLSMTDIIERHKQCFEKWNDSLITQWDSIVQNMNENNTLWRNEMEFNIQNNNVNANNEEKQMDPIVESVFESETQETHYYNEDDDDDNANNIDDTPINDGQDDNSNGGQDEQKMTDMASSVTTNDESDNNNDISHNDWWLFSDEKTNDFIDSLKIDKDTLKLLSYIGAYLNRIIPTSDDLQPHELQKLYIPLDLSDARHVVMACLDGVLFVSLINLVEPDFVDMRAINVPDHQDPKPLSQMQIKENMTTLFGSVRALNLRIPFWSVDNYFDSNNTIDIMIVLIFELFKGMLNVQINAKTHPELVRLCKNDEERKNAYHFRWTQWLNRWLLFIQELDDSSESVISINLALKKSEPSQEIENNANAIRNTLNTTDYHDNLILVCCHLEKEFRNDSLKRIQSHTDEIDLFAANTILNCLKDVVGVQTIIEIQDIASRNPFLQEILLADIFENHNLMEKLTNSDVRRLTLNMRVTTKEDKSLMAWINAFGDAQIRIRSLDGLNDGVIFLKLLDRLHKGCVKWKSVRKDIRHKFDRLGNCKMVLDVCKNNFSFSLVGMGGEDIAEGNQKYTRTLLWQIMRFYSTKQLSELQFDGKAVTDIMMIKWANERVSEYKKKLEQMGDPNNMIANRKLKMNQIKSFHDSGLNDSIFFLNLLSSVKQEWVKYSVVNFIQTISNLDLKHGDPFEKERMANARYCITIIRRLGGEVFVLPQDICRCDQKSNLSILCSIMMIFAKHNKDIELKHINTNSTKIEIDVEQALSVPIYG